MFIRPNGGFLVEYKSRPRQMAYIVRHYAVLNHIRAARRLSHFLYRAITRVFSLRFGRNKLVGMYLDALSIGDISFEVRRNNNNDNNNNSDIGPNRLKLGV